MEATTTTRPDRMDYSLAQHLLHEINDAKLQADADARRTYLALEIRENAAARWSLVIERKRERLADYGYNTRLSTRTGYYVPDGGGSAWRYVSGKRVR